MRRNIHVDTFERRAGESAARFQRSSSVLVQWPWLIFVPETFTQIFGAGIGENRNDRRVRLARDFVRDGKAAGKSGRGAWAHQQTLFARDALHEAIRVFG